MTTITINGVTYSPEIGGCFVGADAVPIWYPNAWANLWSEFCEWAASLDPFTFPGLPPPPRPTRPQLAAPIRRGHPNPNLAHWC